MIWTDYAMFVILALPVVAAAVVFYFEETDQ